MRPGVPRHLGGRALEGETTTTRVRRHHATHGANSGWGSSPGAAAGSGELGAV
jgi:hypothetical protein